MLPFFELVVNENDETGVDFNSFVLRPAHNKPYFAFNKDVKEHFVFNEEKRIVTGVMISANTPIYRSNPDRYVLFKPKTIKVIREKNKKLGFANNVNIEHDSNRVIEGVRMLSDYIITDLKQIPKQFASFNLQVGTWIRSYKVDNPTIWNKIKKGEFSGYSVEGLFEQIEIKLK